MLGFGSCSFEITLRFDQTSLEEKGDQAPKKTAFVIYIEGRNAQSYYSFVTVGILFSTLP